MPSKTWDGRDVSPDPPFGASVIVYRWSDRGLAYLIPHKAHPWLDEGDWAWGPPAGARLPGEPIVQCAKRELIEETGEALPFSRTNFGTDEWLVFVGEWPADTSVTLSDEHDDFRWSPVHEVAEVIGDTFLRVEELVSEQRWGSIT